MESPSRRRSVSSGSMHMSQRSWIERNFQKRECVRFVPSHKDENRCGCGRDSMRHAPVRSDSHSPRFNSLRWNVIRHTDTFPTDAYGIIEFQGGAHPTKAQFVRLSHDTRPELVLQLLLKNWQLDLPKLLISVHGGIANFDLQPKLKRVFRKGLLKAAKTTGAWILTGGTNTGVMRHVGEAVVDRSVKSSSKVVTIGIAPWGVVDNRESLQARDCVRPYHAVARPKSNCAVLNSNHSYFLLVDNGTVGKYGSEITLRRRLEKYISQQRISTRPGDQGQAVPVICVILEGGTNTIRTVLEYVTDSPPVPVVVCDGSGRAADLLAFTHKYCLDDGTMAESLRDQLLLTIEKTFQYSREQAEKLFIELMMCVKKKDLITVFRMGEGPCQDIDLAILTALLKGQRASAPDQLTLALTWNRVDIARSHIFVYGQDWTEGSLEQAMMDALIHDRVDFVKLLLENGVSMQDFITIPRLEELYNTKHGPSHTLRYLVRDVRKNMADDHRYTLMDIGLLVEHLMGGAYRASYCRRKFKTLYNAVMKRSASVVQSHNITSLFPDLPFVLEKVDYSDVFLYPFHDFMVWAVLTNRQKMALFMWHHGEEALAKALMACKLYKAMAAEAAQDDLEPELYDELKGYAKEFQQLAMDLLDHCYKQDDDVTQQLLTYEMKYWSEQTCLSLAVSAKCRSSLRDDLITLDELSRMVEVDELHMSHQLDQLIRDLVQCQEFIAHPCCQILLTDMWMGGLRMRKYTSFWVIIGIFFPPSIITLEFKSKEELQLMPQTMEEHIWDLEENTSVSRSDSSHSDSDNNSVEEDRNQFNARSSLSHNHMGVKITESEPTIPDHLRRLASENDVGFVEGAPFLFRSLTKKSPLTLGKKVYEFYTAPVTKFWMHTLAYLAFMMLFNYVVLVEMQLQPCWQEIYVIAYIFTMALEKIREIITSEPSKASQKVYVYFEEVWNILDTVAVVMFMVGFSIRIVEATMIYGRVIYCLDIILWYIRILDIFSVNKYLGPYVTMVGKMVVDMLTFIVILLIVLMSFGVARQSILNPYEKPSWRLARDIFLMPYFMLYGEVYAYEIDPDCGDKPGMPACHPGRWITPAIMAVYLLVANILLINLLIAVFNNTFTQVNSISRQVWKFQRYHLVLEYESKPLLPPPLIFISHFIMIVRHLVWKYKGKRKFFDNGLKLFLSDGDLEKLHDFEEECVEDFFREKENRFMASTDERIRTTSERVEGMSMRLDDMNQRENTFKMSLQTVDYRLAKLEDILLQTAQSLTSIHTFMADQLDPISGTHAQWKQSGKEEGPGEPHSASLDFERAEPPQSPTKAQRRRELRQRTLMDPRKTKGRPPFSRSNTVPTVPEEGNSVSYRDTSDNKNSSSMAKVRASLANTRIAQMIEKMRDQVVDDKKTIEQQSAGTNVVVVAQNAHGDVVPEPSESPTASSLSVSRPYLSLSAERLSAVDLTDDYPTIADLTRHDMVVEDVVVISSVPPIITTMRTEYTSITDEIDTSCIQARSPPGSPVSSRQFASRDYAVKDLTAEPRKEAVNRELTRLRSAEESEHQQLEGVIRHRMRQISMTESESVSDLARIVIEELTLVSKAESAVASDGRGSPESDVMEIHDIFEDSP